MKAFSLRWRLTMLLVLATAVALGLAAWIVDWRSDLEMRQRFDNALLARAQELAASVWVGGDHHGVETSQLERGFLSANRDPSWYVLRCNGATVSRTRVVPPTMEASSQPDFSDARLPDGRMVREVAFRFTPPDPGRLGNRNASSGATCDMRYAQDRAPLDAILHSLDWLLLGTLLGASGLVLLVTPLLVRRGLRPLSVLATAMADIGPDAPGRRLPDHGTRELAPLVARFNDVLARMDAGLARERDFAAGLAHELRTRLTELRTLVEIETRYPSGRSPVELLADAGAIGAELETTMIALLQLTRIESGLDQTRREPVVLASLLQRAQARHRAAASLRNMSIELAVQASITLHADSALLDVVLDNLIGNAVAYAPERSVVSLNLHPGELDVVNQAPLLRAEDLDNFGQRFWRKSEVGGGHAGLGLALATAAARVQRMGLHFGLDERGALHAVLRWQE